MDCGRNAADMQTARMLVLYDLHIDIYMSRKKLYLT